MGDGLTVNRSQGRVRAGVVALPDIAALRSVEVGRRTLAARDLGRGRLTGGELEEIARVGRMVEMAVEPPLVKGVVDERSNRPVIVRERLAGDVEPVHARMEDGCGVD